VRLHDLVGAVPAASLRGDPDVEITGVTHTTDKVVPGVLFCCVPGSRVDGHDLAPEALSAGAAALLVERVLPVDAPQLVVPAVRVAMGPLAAAFHGNPSAAMTVFGVTGTNGKTTTTYVLEAIAGAAGLVPGVIGTVETRIDGVPVPGTLTTPESTDLQALFADMRDRGVGAVAMEVSSHALVQGRVDGTRFAAAGFLNLSHDHLDYHGSLDAYFEAKALLFDPARTGAAAVNLDDERGVELAARCRQAGLALTTFSVDPARGADVWASRLHLAATGTRFVLHGPGHEAPVASHLVGRFNVANSVAAAAVALAGGLPFDAVAAGLAAPIRVPGRFEPVGEGRPFAVLVDYAHTPDALDQALASAREVTSGRLLVVFGCGGDRDREKRPVMGRVAAERADAVYVTSDNPRSEDPDAIIAAVVDGIPPTTDAVVEADRRAAIRLALADARPGDLVVVAGKGHETGQTIGDTVLPFDDRLVVAEELEALRCA